MTYEEAFEKYGDNLFGITTLNDVIYVPITFEDLCFSTGGKSKYIEEGDYCETDIRYYYFEDFFPKFKKINPKYQEIYNNFKNHKEMIANCIMLSLSLYGRKEKVNKDFFASSLTYNEKQAFSAILEHLTNGTGYVSISKLVEETKISRPVFKNLMIKMQKGNVAEISNSGVKGTYIKMLIEV